MNNIAIGSRIRTKRFNYNDLSVMVFIILFSTLFIYGWEGMHHSFQSTSSILPISLNPSHLPYYTLRSIIRLLIGMVASFLFALIAGYASAKNKHIARVMLPFINFMESVPLLGFLTFTVTFFIFLFPHSVMGLEGAAIFGVFTGQAWNMALILYQTIRIVPQELCEAAEMFQLNAWQRFWRIEMPYSIPGLLWNTMVSQSAAWFALVGTEAIPIGNDNVMLPGLGSYIQLALDHGDTKGIIYALLCIIASIIFFDQFIFRPLVKWSEKFKYESTMSNTSNSSWVYHILKKGIFITIFSNTYRKFKYLCINSPTWLSKKYNIRKIKISKFIIYLSTISWYLTILISCSYGAVLLWNYFPNGSMLYLFPLMWETTWRVVVAMLISVIVCTPLGIYIGVNPTLTRIFQPIIQVLAAIPQPIFFPIVAIAILMGGGSLNFWVVPLIMAGTSWYVLFNVIAGASCIPNDLLEMSKIFNLHGIKWLFKFSIPAVFSYVVCGIISAAGGAWNSAIAAELIEWGNKHISVNGLGALISKTTADNQLPEAALACSALCVLVALCVIFIWKPLYKIAETRYKI